MSEADSEPITAYRAVCEECSPKHRDSDEWSDAQIRRRESIARADAARHNDNNSCGKAYVREIDAVEKAIENPPPTQSELPINTDGGWPS